MKKVTTKKNAMAPGKHPFEDVPPMQPRFDHEAFCNETICSTPKPFHWNAPNCKNGNEIPERHEGRGEFCYYSETNGREGEEE